jgi:hypothetical protein
VQKYGEEMVTPTIWKLRYPLIGAAVAALALATTTALAGSELGGSRGSGMSRGAEAAGQLKKKCRVVVKTVHGKKKHVRVCTKPKPKPKPVAPTKLATQLAAGIDSAHTNAARYTAILRVMSAIKLSVYNGKTGKALAKGLDTNKYDAYLFGGEVRGMAAAFGGAKSFSTADLASFLTTVLGRKANPVSVEAANGLVSGLVQVALANPKDAASVVPLLVRDLGLAMSKPVDLARAAGADPVPLDPVQLELTELYLLYPIVHRGSQRHVAELRRPATQGTAVCKVLKYAINHFNPNTYLDSEHAVHVVTDTAVPTAVTEVAKEILETLKFVGTATALEALDLVFTIVSGVHGSILALGLELKSGPPLNQGTAYGRSGLPGQGNPMHFRVQAVFHDVLSPEDTECLNKMGFEMPEKPSVAGMDIAWHDEDVSGKPLYEHGSLEFDLPGVFANGRTNEDGVSTVNFTPKDEVVPGIGQLVTDSGGALPRALWGFKFKNPFGAITQLLIPITGAELRWTVQYHKPRGFGFAWTPDGYPPHPPEGWNTRYSVQAHVCGDDPYAAPWEGQEQSWESAGPYYDPSTHHGSLSFDSWAFTPGAPTSPIREDGFALTEITGQLVPGPPPIVRVQIRTDYFDGSQGWQTYDMPVHDVSYCPEND